MTRNELMGQSFLNIMTKTELETRLKARVKKPVFIILTKNRVRMITVKNVHGAYELRLHEAFTEASPEVIEELARWIKKPKKVQVPVLRDFINQINPVKTTSTKPVYLENLPLFETYTENTNSDFIPQNGYKTKGNIYDLNILLDKINQTYFKSELNIKITWGRKFVQKRSKSRRFGSFNHQKQLITIHPILDDERVPEFVILFTIYHEALHSLQNPELKRPHNKEFRKYERMYPDYEKVKVWRKKNEDFLFRGKN